MSAGLSQNKVKMVLKEMWHLHISVDCRNINCQHLVGRIGSFIFLLKQHILQKMTEGKASPRATMEKGDWAVTDAQIRTLISHAKSPGTGPRTLDVPLTLGRLQTKEEKSTNQWAFSPTGGRTGRWGVVGWGSECWAGPGLLVSMKGMHED